MVLYSSFRCVRRAFRPATRGPRGVERLIQLPSISISSSPSRGATSSSRPSLTACRDWRYSLMSPSVDPGERVLEDVVRVLGQGADAQLTARNASKCVISSAAAMLMNPERDHIAARMPRQPPQRGAHGARDVHIFLSGRSSGVRALRAAAATPRLQ